MRNINKYGWKIKELGEVCEIISGKNQKKVENPSGKYPIMGSGGIMSYADNYLCPENSVILGRKGTINRPFKVKQKSWIVYFTPKVYQYFNPKVYHFNLISKSVSLLGA
ncbi:MAG: restriction endonuclease subunit S, partial [Tissierellia bacterium]|nr:restriction endonuclease subunit S [Tissierellia bacterium]